MANNGVVLFAPLNTDDVSNVLGHASHDVATLCSSPKINIFAMYKPFRYDKVSEVTTAERQSKSYGIALGYIAKSTSAAVNLVNNQQTALPSVPKWTYEPPRPGTDWCRMTDFINENSPTGPGYNHSAKPPMSGFNDITIFQSEFGSESKVYSFNFKWGAASNQGANDTSGIEIPITVLKSDITNGTWRFGLLIFFPVNGKYTVGVAGANKTIPQPTENFQPGDMMIRPAMTGRISSLLTNAYNSGVRELDAIPFLASNLSRGGNGNEDSWRFQASSEVISMPMGEKIKIYLSDRFKNVVITFNKITITYLTASGSNAGPNYTLYPTTNTAQMYQTSFADPSASNAVRCKIVLEFDITGEMASGDKILKSQLKVGLNNNAFIDTFPSTLERDINKNGNWSTISQIDALNGRYRITATDTGPTTETSAIMNFFAALPRGLNKGLHMQIRPSVSLDGANFMTTNYFYHNY